MENRPNPWRLNLLVIAALMFAVFGAVARPAAALGYTITVGDAFVDANNPPCTTGITTMLFTAVLSPPAPASGISFDFAAVDGPPPNGATANLDYVPILSNGTANFSAGATSATIPVIINCNSGAEGDEIFYLNLANPVGATLPKQPAIGTIRGVPTLSISDASVVEGNTGTSDLEFVVSIPRAAATDLDFTADTADDTATVGDNDYTQLSAAPFTIPAGDLSTKVIVKVKGDTKNEANETLDLSLTAGGANVFFADNAAKGTIVNDDDAPVVTVACTSPVAEGTASSCTVSLSAASGQDTTVKVSTLDGTAQAGSDYTAIATPIDVTIAAGATSAAPFSVSTLNDTPAVNEADENFFVVLSAPTNAIIGPGLDKAEVVITDNDPLPTVAIGNAQVLEGPDGDTRVLAFPVNLSGTPTQQTITIKYSTADGTAQADATAGAVPDGGDYLSASGGIATFTPGVTSQNISIIVNGDNLDEPPFETFTVTIAASDPSGLVITNKTGTGTIQDDDNPPTASVTIAPIVEGNSGTTPATFNVVLSGPSGFPIAFNYATANSTAIAPDDYSTASGTVNIDAGDTTGSFSVDVNGDKASENNETFLVNYSGASHVALPTSTTATIIDDDSGPNISVVSKSVTEGNSASVELIELTLDAPSGKEVRVTYSTKDGTAQSDVTPDAIPSGGDYTRIAASEIVFPPNVTSLKVPVEIRGDQLDEDNETFSITLSNAVNGTITGGTGTVTILDDDTPPTVSIGDATTPSEGNDGQITSAVFVISLSAQSGRRVSVEFSTADIEAKGGVDYVPDSRTITFEPGATTQTVSIAVIGDNADEPNESFAGRIAIVNLGTLTPGRMDGKATIYDDDGSTLSVGDVSKNEGSGNSSTLFRFPVTLSGATSFPVTVRWSTGNLEATAPADFGAVSNQTLTFNANGTQYADVAVVGDDAAEADESFVVTLSSPSGAQIGDGLGRGEIVNDDHIGVTVGCTPRGAGNMAPTSVVTVTEGDAGVKFVDCQINLSASSSVTLTIYYQTHDGTATAPQDYVSAANNPIIVPPGTTSQRLSVAVNGDKQAEANEDFTLQLSGAKTTAIPVSIVGDNLYEGDEFFWLNIESSVDPMVVLTQNQVKITIVDDEALNRVYFPLVYRFAGTPLGN